MILQKPYLTITLLLAVCSMLSANNIDIPTFNCDRLDWEEMHTYTQTHSKEVSSCLLSKLNKITSQKKTENYIFPYYFNLSKAFRYQADYGKSIIYARRALNVTHTPRDSIQSLLLLSRAYRANDDVSKALEQTLNALKIAEYQSLNNNEKIYTHIELARIYYTLQDSTLAAEHLNQIEKRVEQTSLPTLKAEYYYQRARVKYWYHRHSGFEEIINLLHKSLDLFENTNEYYQIATTLDFLGVCYADIEDYDKSHEFYTKSLSLKNTLSDDYGKAITYNNFGLLQFIQFKDKEAIEYYNKSIAISKGIEAYELTARSYQNIASLHEENNSLKTSIEYLRKQMTARDTLKARQKANLSLDMSIQYSIEGEINEKEQKIKTQKKQLNYLSLTSGLLFLIAILTYLLYRQISQVNTFKNQLFSIIGHDLRGMMSSAYAAKRSIERTKKQAENQSFNKPINKMGSVIDGLNGFIENMLYWGFAQTNRVNIERKKFDVEEVTDEVVGYFKYDLERKNIQLKKDIPTNFQIYADEETTKVVLRNLLSNAIKFSPIDSEILVSARQNRRYNLVAVKDSGAGIPPEKTPHLFAVSKEKVSRGTLGEKGTGMGLWLCKEMMRRNKGKITVESSLQEGTCFTLHFPKI